MTSNEITDRDVERLLQGDEPAALADAVPAIGALRALSVAPDETHAARAGAALAGVVTAAPATAPIASPSRWRLRAAIAGGLALVGAGLVGGAAAADDAAPGDALYGLDRALEKVGINDGGDSERITEAMKLEDEGDTEGALEHVAELMDDDPASTSALLAAAALIRANGSDSSAEVHQRVADMLEWMATTDATGKEFGQGVSRLARGLNPEDEVVTGDEAVVEDVTPGKSGDTPAANGETGKPEDAGKPADKTTTNGSGKPENTGKPDGVGKPEGVGKP